jgi:DNA-binding transcriptional LysR family regulator
MSGGWDLIETFLAVMRSGSLSAASRELSVAQPTIRRRVEVLESTLGGALFTRGPNGLVPTEAATTLLSTAERMEAAARAFERGASTSEFAGRGTVRIAASEVVGVEVLPNLLQPLVAGGAGLDLEIVTSNRLVDLLRRDADIAVRMTTPTQAALVARSVGPISLGLFATRELLQSHGRAPRKLAELAGWPLIGPDQDRATWRALAATGFDAPRSQFVVRSDNDLVQLAAVRAGLGIGVCQLPLAAKDPNLERVLPRFSLSLEVFVVMHEDQRKAPKVRRVFDHLVSELAAYGASHK